MSRASVASRFAGLLVVVASRAWGQGVILQIKPHAGDTIRMLLDQRAEMTGVKHTTAGEATAMVVNTLKMFSRAIVEGSDRARHGGAGGHRLGTHVHDR